MAKALTNQGFFLSPIGKLIQTDSSGTHIGTVINNPEKFGLDSAYIKSVYKKKREKMGVEGKAREEILKGLTKKGWIRLRRYPNKYWSVQFDKMGPRVRKIIARWAASMVGGKGGWKEKDKYMPVIALGFSDGYRKQIDINDIAKTGTIADHIEVVDIKDYINEDLKLSSLIQGDISESDFRWDL